jgi:hypothetical protein
LAIFFAGSFFFSSTGLVLGDLGDSGVLGDFLGSFALVGRAFDVGFTVAEAGRFDGLAGGCFGVGGSFLGDLGVKSVVEPDAGLALLLGAGAALADFGRSFFVTEGFVAFPSGLSLVLDVMLFSDEVGESKALFT